MAQPSLPAKSGDGFLARLLSALVLAPLVLGAIYLGPPYSDALILLAGAAMAWEWARLCAGDPLRPAEYLFIGAVILVLLAALLADARLAGWLLAAGAAVSLLAAAGRRSADGTSRLGAWLAAGMVYVALPLLAFLFLRGEETGGRNLIFWLLAVVWSTDIGAYFVGRTIGGPKLLPRISPKKTWAGLIGGMLAAAIVGVAVGLWLGGGQAPRLALLAALLAFISQGGDFLESALKRRFNRKDSSRLIPGHGGILDRVDGLVAAVLGLALLVRIGQGPSLG